MTLYRGVVYDLYLQPWGSAAHFDERHGLFQTVRRLEDSRGSWHARDPSAYACGSGHLGLVAPD
jgi:hypothetical protein